jgi:hypothetical protein
MLDAVIELDPDSMDGPGELTQAELHKLRLALDHDSDPDTPAQIYDDFLSLLNASRSDTRYGEGVFGEMYISSKVNGQIYLVTNSLPLFGDYNQDRVVDAADYVAWRDSLGAEGYHLAADGDGNGTVGAADYEVWHRNFGRSRISSTISSATAPEPGGMSLVMIGIIAYGWGPRRMLHLDEAHEPHFLQRLPRR